MKSNYEQITIQYPDEWVKAETKERKYFFDLLEKQGKQKSANKNEEVDNLHNYLYGEQKPTDNVEPKFKVGDWVINTITKEVEQVIELTDCEYICSGHLIISYNEQHLLKSWTIQDAKDGDVLADDYGIYIFEKFDECDKNCFVCIGAYQYSQKIYECEQMLCSTDVHPATKEQCNLLFQKMKEAGYEWDAEKKELKKVEQKPATMSLDEAIEHCKEKSCGNSECALEHKQLEKWLTELKELKEQKPTWSEEDEDVINHLLAICAGAKRYRQFAGCSQDDVAKYQTWLKLFKDRVQLQLTPEWSEDDEKTIHLACEFIRHHSRKEDSISGIDCIELVKRLKSIKPQSTWKPSDEQMKALSSISVTGTISYAEQGQELIALYNDLRELREE